jgi:hypothetical protein
MPLLAFSLQPFLTDGTPQMNPFAKAQREAKPEKQQDMLREMF